MHIQLEINGKTVSVPEGATIMEAARRLGVYVPHFCYHPKLSIAANCRMCMVDVQKAPKAIPACATPAVAGMVVRTDSERAKRAQQGVMEFLLINHPLDCPICDQGGECQLQDLAVGYGVSSSRYTEEKRVVFEKNLGPLISTDMTRCIHCTRCVRFGREVAGVMELGLTGRGEHAEIMPFVERTVNSELSGNMIDICPVGALTSKPFRYSARTWELRQHQSVATHDSWGSHLRVQTKNGEVRRVLPSDAPGIVEPWISDADRFSYEGLAAPDRARAPMVCQEGGRMLKETPWQDALAITARRLQEARASGGGIGFLASPRVSCEEGGLLARLAQALECPNIDHRLWQTDFSGQDVAGLGVAPAELSCLRRVLLVGADPARELPLLAAKLRARGGKLAVYSIGAQDIADSVGAQAQALMSPTDFARALAQLARQTDSANNADGADNADALSRIAAALAAPLPPRPANATANADAPDTVIWLGDSARAARNYGALCENARQLAQQLGARLGMLADGGNGLGLRQMGALPAAGGLSTGGMLRANLRAVVLYRCEPADFAEAALVQKLLQRADFVCAITTHTGGIAAHAGAVLPAAEFTETDGAYINGFSAATQAAPAANPPGRARPGWKILRMLGEHLGAAGFDFADLSGARALLEHPAAPAPDAAAAAPEPEPQPQNGSSHPVFCLHGAAPAYAQDMLLRRATALSQTHQAKQARMARMHPQDLADAGLTDGGAAMIIDAQGNQETAQASADARLARGVMAFCPTLLTSATHLRVRPVAIAKTA